MKKIATRIAAGTIGALGVAGVAFGAAGAAHAGTMPIVRPGEPTVTMTISNHTDKPEYLVGSSAAGGEWVNGPAQVLYPGATEIVSAAVRSAAISTSAPPTGSASAVRPPSTRSAITATGSAPR